MQVWYPLIHYSNECRSKTSISYYEMFSIIISNRHLVICHFTLLQIFVIRQKLCKWFDLVREPCTSSLFLQTWPKYFFWKHFLVGKLHPRHATKVMALSAVLYQGLFLVQVSPFYDVWMFRFQGWCTDPTNHVCK